MILAVEPESRRVYPVTGAALLGMDTASFIEAAKKGEWGESVQPPQFDGLGGWWPWEEFKRRADLV